jgi:hypothetical protein
MNPILDALLFDVACLCYANGGVQTNEAVTVQTLEKAVAALVRERDEEGWSVDLCLRQLASAAVQLYHPASALTPRRAIFSFTLENIPRELADLPYKLEGATMGQQLDVLALLEQAFGGRADCSAGPDAYATLLRRCELLDRENRDLRRELEASSLRFGVRDALESNRELVSALYHAVAMADAAKVRRDIDSDGSKSRRDVAVACSLLSGPSLGNVDNTSPTSQLTQQERDAHQRLVDRLAALEKRWASDLAEANNRALDAERAAVKLQEQLIAAKKNEYLAIAGSPMPGLFRHGSSTPGSSRDELPKAALVSSFAQTEGNETEAANADDDENNTASVSWLQMELDALKRRHEDARETWEHERRRLVEKLAIAAERLMSDVLAQQQHAATISGSSRVMAATSPTLSRRSAAVDSNATPRRHPKVPPLVTSLWK